MAVDQAGDEAPLARSRSRACTGGVWSTMSRLCDVACACPAAIKLPWIRMALPRCGRQTELVRYVVASRSVVSALYSISTHVYAAVCDGMSPACVTRVASARIAIAAIEGVQVVFVRNCGGMLEVSQ